MNRRERIIELATQIAVTREKLRAMVLEMDELLPTEEAPVSTSTPVVQKGVPIPLALTERVIRFLESKKPLKFGASGIAQGIGLDSDKLTSLRSTLVRLVDEQRIERVEPGVYRAKQEQQHVAA